MTSIIAARPVQPSGVLPFSAKGARPPALAGGARLGSWKDPSMLDWPLFALMRDGGAALVGIYTAIQAKGINTLLGSIGLGTAVLGAMGVANDAWKIFANKPLIGDDDWGSMALATLATAGVGYLMFSQPKKSPFAKGLMKASE